MLYSQVRHRVSLARARLTLSVRPGGARGITMVVAHPLHGPLCPAHLMFFLAVPFPVEPARHT
ncbi:MAG TPA: hypothetical protein VFA10_31540 [Ktedonobacteraceae bacterium]|nr:hypothetical protein [Ktedonobacteraceae bacterium]